METDTRVLNDFRRRMDKLGIKCEFAGNIPWIYLEKVNGKRVTERFCRRDNEDYQEV